MALQATHIRFALDMQQRLGATSVAEYLSGAVYPDSRYITKVDRVMIHPDNLINSNDAKISDFKKGWYTHVLYDSLLKQYTDRQLANLINSVSEQSQYALYTALKIIQDIQDAKAINVNQYLEFLTPPLPVFEEIPQQIERYYQIIKQLYINPSGLTFASYNSLFEDFELNPSFVAEIKSQLSSLQDNPEVQKFIQGVYSETLQLA